MLRGLSVLFGCLSVGLMIHLGLFFRKRRVRLLLRERGFCHPYHRMCLVVGVDSGLFLKRKLWSLGVGTVLAGILLVRPSAFFSPVYPLFVGFVVPDLILLGQYGALQIGRKKEIELLKRLFILNGSVQPVVFDEVFRILRDNARSLRPLFDRLEQKRSSNTEDMRQVYKTLGQECRDLEIRLFLEKLYQADCLDLQQGVQSLQMDQMIQKMTRRREAEQLRNVIELFGLSFSVILAGLLTYYLLLPWLALYSTQMVW